MRQVVHGWSRRPASEARSGDAAALVPPEPERGSLELSPKVHGELGGDLVARCASACAPCRWPVATAVARCWAARCVSPAPKATTPSAMPTGTSLTASPVSRISRRATATCSAASADASRRSRAARRAAPGTWRCRCGRRPSGTATGRRRTSPAPCRGLRAALRPGAVQQHLAAEEGELGGRVQLERPAHESVERVPPGVDGGDPARQRVDRLVTAVDGRRWQRGEELVEPGRARRPASCPLGPHGSRGGTPRRSAAAHRSRAVADGGASPKSYVRLVEVLDGVVDLAAAPVGHPVDDVRARSDVGARVVAPPLDVVRRDRALRRRSARDSDAHSDHVSSRLTSSCPSRRASSCVCGAGRGRCPRSSGWPASPRADGGGRRAAPGRLRRGRSVPAELDGASSMTSADVYATRPTATSAARSSASAARSPTPSAAARHR